MANLLETLKSVLEKDERFVNEDGELLRNNVIEKANKLDADLLNLLFGNADLKAKFFVKVGDYTVFDQKTFMYVVSNREFLPDSYTRFKQNVGLATKDGEFLKNKNDIELVFPYKDCVLEGGQTKEDEKRGEIFYNELLADDEVDKLLAPKVLVNAKRYTKDGEESDITLNEDDDLIIKGNNLLVISSLLKKYEGKIKLIYIDPPYNTGGAGNTFAYNNTFNHSTWLTFMKNRIEISKKLLSENGCICISIDDAEYAHLKILCDEIFCPENYVGTIIVESNPRGRTINSQFATCHEYALFYAKNIEQIIINNQELTEEQEEDFSEKDSTGQYRFLPFRRSGGTSTPKERPNSEFTLYYSKSQKNIIAVGGERLKPYPNEYEPSDIKVIQNGTFISVKPEVFLSKCTDVVPILPLDTLGKRRVWRWSDRNAILQSALQGDFYVDYNKNGYSVKLKDRIKNGRKPKTIWSDSKYDASAHGTILLKTLFNGEKIFSYPKSLFTVEDIIKMLTDKNSFDIILDFFAGSGTTAHAVIELNKLDLGNRKFILCEQMDYIEGVTIPRIDKIMDKRKSFVYCELAKLNQNYVEKIEAATTKEQLTKLKNEIIKTGFISCKVKIKDIDNNAEEWEALSVEDKKKFLMELLDKNMLYVNYSDMDDADFAVKEEDKKFTRSFYGEE